MNSTKKKTHTRSIENCRRTSLLYTNCQFDLEEKKICLSLRIQKTRVKMEKCVQKNVFEIRLMLMYIINIYVKVLLVPCYDRNKVNLKFVRMKYVNR